MTPRSFIEGIEQAVVPDVESGDTTIAGYRILQHLVGYGGVSFFSLDRHLQDLLDRLVAMGERDEQEVGPT